MALGPLAVVWRPLVYLIPFAAERERKGRLSANILKLKSLMPAKKFSLQVVIL